MDQERIAKRSRSEGDSPSASALKDASILSISDSTLVGEEDISPRMFEAELLKQHARRRSLNRTPPSGGAATSTPERGLGAAAAFEPDVTRLPEADGGVDDGEGDKGVKRDRSGSEEDEERERVKRANTTATTVDGLLRILGNTLGEMRELMKGAERVSEGEVLGECMEIIERVSELRAEERKSEREREDQAKCRACLRVNEERKRAREIAEVGEILKNGGGEKEFLSVCEKEWAEEMFSSVTVGAGGMNVAFGGNVVLLFSGNKEGGTALEKTAAKWKPDALELLEGVRGTGGVDYVVDATINSGAKEIRRRVTCVASLESGAKAAYKIAEAPTGLAEQVSLNEARVLVDSGLDSTLLEEGPAVHQD